MQNEARSDFMENREQPSLWTRIKFLLDKENLAGILADYPFLRLMLFARWFRIAFVILFLGLTGFALMLPKIWRTSPKGFEPIVRVSLLDFIQCWALKNSALKAEQAGQMEKAIHAWQMAVANNLADPALLRGMLNAVCNAKDVKTYTGMALGQSIWLLRIANTNMADLELAVRFYEKTHVPDWTVALLESRAEELPPPLLCSYIKALMTSGQSELFARKWQELAAKIPSNPEMDVYRAAYQAGWGPPGGIAEGWQKLSTAQQVGEFAELSHRLQLAICVHLSDLNRFKPSFDALVERKADSPNDHVTYWRMLMVAGRKEEALRQAQAYVNPPSTAMELLNMANAYVLLGLRETAGNLYSQCYRDFANNPSVWIAYGNYLVQEKDWQNLTKLLLEMRSVNQTAQFLLGYSYYLEGVAEAGQGRKTFADAAFQKVAEQEIKNPGLALSLARMLMKYGYLAEADHLAVRLKPTMEKEPAYWRVAWEVGELQRSGAKMLEAAQKLYELNPANPAVLNNYAAALITVRQRPDEAVRLTLQFMGRNPNSSGAIINHCLALLQNLRTEEAEALLQKVDRSRIDPAEFTAYDLVRLEIHYNKREFAAASQVAERIDPKNLFAEECQWLEMVKKQFPAKP